MAELDWHERALPILEAVYQAEEAGDDVCNVNGVARSTGLDSQLAKRTTVDLVESGYLAGSILRSAQGPVGVSGLRLLERGRRAIGQLPPGPAEALIAVLDRQIAAATDPGKQSALRRFRDALAAFVRDVGAQAVGTIVGNAVGGGSQ
jgi:hypothetical protein